MSIENVKQFYQAVVQDPALQQPFQSVSDEESLVHLAVELGQQQGYSFTPAEVMQAIAITQASTDTSGMTELDDEQLESVAGGKGGVTDWRAGLRDIADPPPTWSLRDVAPPDWSKLQDLFKGSC